MALRGYRSKELPQTLRSVLRRFERSTIDPVGRGVRENLEGNLPRITILWTPLPIERDHIGEIPEPIVARLDGSRARGMPQRILTKPTLDHPVDVVSTIVEAPCLDDGATSGHVLGHQAQPREPLGQQNVPVKERRSVCLDAAHIPVTLSPKRHGERMRFCEPSIGQHTCQRKEPRREFDARHAAHLFHLDSILHAMIDLFQC